jgi:hypothetical protein
MQIEVEISDWEQACCGSPFGVGDQTTWTVFAAAPSKSSAGASPHFREEHHGETPHNVPHWPITGTVVAISGISYPVIPAPGNPGVMTSDRSTPRTHPLMAVAGAVHVDADGTTYRDAREATSGQVDVECAEYRVLLELPDGTPLPEYVPAAAEN